MKRLLMPWLLLLLALCHCGRSLDINSKEKSEGLNGNLSEPPPGTGGGTTPPGIGGGGSLPSLPTGPTRGFVALDPASDSGRNGSDGVTNDNTPTFYGSADPNVDVWIEVSQQVKGWGRSDAGGNFRITVSPLSDGAHVVRARWIYNGEIRSTPPL